MDNDKLMPELLNALNGIQSELRRLNQTLSTMAGASTTEKRTAPSSYGDKRPSASAPRGGSRAREGGYGRETAGGSDTAPSYRFAKKKSAGPGRSAAGRPGGKPPAKGKKGDGYPKKPR